MSEKKPETSVEKKPVQQEANVKNEEKKIETYKVYGTEFSVQNPEYIEFYKSRFKIMAVRYNLLGRVNNNSVYVIPNEIKADLINMPKEIEDMAEDYYTASCRYMKKYFYFKVKLTMLENGKARASLYIYENIAEFFDDDYIITRVADYIDDYNEDFRVKVRKYFNLVDVAVPVTDFMVPNLAVLMQDNSDLNLAISPLYEIAAQIYLLSMIKLLENAGEVGEEILRRYYKLKESYAEELKNEKFKNTLLKILFDRAVDSFGGLEKLKINKIYIEKNVQEMNKTIKAIEEKQKKFGGIEILNDKKEEKKKQEPLKNESGRSNSGKGGNTNKGEKNTNNKGGKNTNKGGKVTNKGGNNRQETDRKYFDLEQTKEIEKREREEDRKNRERNEEKRKKEDEDRIVAGNEKEKNNIDSLLDEDTGGQKKEENNNNILEENVEIEENNYVEENVGDTNKNLLNESGSIEEGKVGNKKESILNESESIKKGNIGNKKESILNESGSIENKDKIRYEEEQSILDE